MLLVWMYAVIIIIWTCLKCVFGIEQKSKKFMNAFWAVLYKVFHHQSETLDVCIGT